MYKLFSQRKKEVLGNVSDVYEYETFSQGFRNQFLHIIIDLFSKNKQNEYMQQRGWWFDLVDFWDISCSEFAREKGLKCLRDHWGYHENEAPAFENYVDSSDDADFLDFMDFVLTEVVAKQTVNYVGEDCVNKAICELNYRFRQHSLGYEFINGNLIEKTNELLHREVVKPAIKLLHDKRFAGAEQEYFMAFDCFKRRNNKDAILNAIKSFESVLKIICKEMKYDFDNEKDTAKQLLQHLTDNGFYPPYLESHMNGIRTTLESGAPTLRNKNAGHGQGQEVVNLSDEYVEYALNLVATNIVFLVKLLAQKKGIK